MEYLQELIINFLIVFAIVVGVFICIGGAFIVHDLRQNDE